ncbi:IclR family transcriptional regulator [Gordonia liuliyuniae]|uniref:IclR family transcriptional regulator n=1 Tax=Gordonia liuliyuniae TaxID=2911517 RepID=A0ABS9IPE8_9ACTN|nr:IclR family transcriptional regulator [Gordonia liuliyuniae]MCF8587446.1 IclR family transcriptional regulator [Gordonia liuliyuniae]
MHISSTVDQALRLLLHLTDSPDQTPADLARDLDMNRTTVHRLLATLHGRGFVTRVGGAAVYSIGPTVLRMAESVGPDIRTVAHHVVEQLSEKTSETALLFVPEFSGRRPQAIAVDQVETRAHVVRVEFTVGHRIPLHQGAAAQAILAHAAPDVVEAALSNADDPDAVRAALARTRERGYSATHDELLLDVAGIAAPVLDSAGHPLGSVSIVAPSSRAEQLNGMVDDLLESVRIIQDLVTS